MTTAMSSKDAAFLVSVMKHMTGNPVVNWEAVTAEMGLKNVKVTRTRYGQIKSKLEASAAADPRTKSPTDTVDENGESEPKTPPKRKRATTKKETPRKASKMVAGAAKEESAEEEDDEV